MKRSHADMAVTREPLENASDRAHQLRMPGEVRISLGQIGFWNQNRGGMGLSSHHVHEIANDCMANMTKLARYGHVDLVEIPPDRVEDVRAYNRQRCEADPFMPRYSDDIMYVCAGKTHFTHAQKLGNDGNRYLHNVQGPQSLIRWKPEDEEANMIQRRGPVCAIFRKELFDDADAMHALASQDNLNASVQMDEDEMQVFGRVCLLVDNIAASENSQLQGPIMEQKLLASLRQVGLGRFTEDEFMHFIRLRLNLEPTIAKVFTTCQFTVCSGRVKVKPADFGLAAKLDPRAPWSMVCLMLCQYIGTMDAIGNPNHVVTTTTFIGRQELVAKRLQKDVVAELVKESAFVIDVEKFTLCMLRHYGAPSGSLSGSHALTELLHVRARFLANTGRFLLTIGAVMDHAEKKAKALQAPLGPDEKLVLITTETNGKFGLAEEHLRRQLVDKGLYSNATLPAAMYADAPAQAPPPVGSRGERTPLLRAPPFSQLPKVKTEPGSLECPLEVALSQELEPSIIDQALRHLYQRLGVQGCGEEVLVSPGHAKQKPPPSCRGVKLEDVTDADAVVEVSAVGAWVKALLIDVELHERIEVGGLFSRCGSVVDDSRASAVVEVLDESKRRLIVHPDDLRPCVQSIPRAPIIVHPIQQEAGQALTLYDYDASEDAAKIACVSNVIMWAHMSAETSVADLRVTMQSKDGKSPMVLQVRANRDFKKGTLVLVPAGGRVVVQGGSVTATGGRAAATGLENNLHAGSLIHESMLTEAPLRVCMSTWPVGKKLASTEDYVPEKNNESFRVISPLMDKKNHAASMENLNPYWALLRCRSSKDPSNMVLEEQPFTDGGLDLKAAKFPPLPRGFRMKTSVTIARNSSNIEQGQVLVLPWSE